MNTMKKSLVDRLNADAEKERAEEEKRWNSQSPLERLEDFPRVMPLVFIAAAVKDYYLVDTPQGKELTFTTYSSCAGPMAKYIKTVISQCGATLAGDIVTQKAEGCSRCTISALVR